MGTRRRVEIPHQTMRRLSILTLLVAAVAAIWVAVDKAQDYERYRDALTWVETEADLERIIALRVQTNAWNTRGWKVEATYRYEFGGVTYESDRVDVYGKDATFRSESAATDFRDRTVAADPLIAYVNPDDPIESVLLRTEQDASQIWKRPAVVMLIGVLMSAVFLRASRRDRRKAEGDHTLISRA